MRKCWLLLIAVMTETGCSRPPASAPAAAASAHTPARALEPVERAAFDSLLQAVLPIAQRLQAKFQNFIPIGAFLAPSGTVQFVAASTGADTGSTTDMLSILHDGLMASHRQATLRAFAVVTDGYYRVAAAAPRRDAILVHLEYQTGEAISAAVPYTRLPDGTYQYEPAVFGAAAPQIFVNERRAP